MESVWAANVKAMKMCISLCILFNHVFLHTELKVELKTMQYNYKLSLRGLLLQLIL